MSRDMIFEHYGRTLREYRRGVNHGLFGVGAANVSTIAIS